MNRIYTKDILKKVFKDNEYKIVSRLYGGMMNISYLIEDEYQRKYIMYIPNGKANKLVNRPNELANHQIAYKLGITSRNLYFDTLRGIKINDYIEGTSLDKYEGEINYQKVADLLHILHSSKELCPNDYNPLQRYYNYEKKALSYQPLSQRYYKSRDFFFAYKDYIESHYEKCVCHNDYQKSNIVVGNDDEYKLIDFEFAGNNDPVYDIAAFGNNSVDEGEELLKHYFVNPGEEQYKKYYLWRVFISLQWFLVAISKHYQKEGAGTGFNFMKVAEYFLLNAEEAKRRFERLFVINK